MSFPEELAVASRNPGKIREILEICRGWPVRWRTAEEAPDDWPDVEETGSSYLENALLKARAVAAALGIPAVADDSGIEVDALGGEPGMRSARYAGPGATDRENLEMLMRALAGASPERGTARYRCAAAVAWPDGDALWAEGTCEGRLITEERGSGGFGYDPIFVPEGSRRTMAELTPEEKNRISHRGRAFWALRELIEARA
jgi:XTP/dITP diphosphohydrolase